MKQNKPLSIDLRQIANLYSTIIEKIVYQSDSNFHFETLQMIGNHQGSILQSRVAELLYIDKSHMASIVYYLTSEGYIDTETSPIDRRDSLINLSPKGTDSLRKIEEAVQEINERITDEIGNDALENLRETLSILKNKLEKEYSGILGMSITE